MLRCGLNLNHSDRRLPQLARRKISWTHRRVFFKEVSTYLVGYFDWVRSSGKEDSELGRELETHFHCYLDCRETAQQCSSL